MFGKYCTEEFPSLHLFLKTDTILFMYYSYQCSYCRKLFYTYSSSRKVAASILYHGIKAHLIYYNEDYKEYQFDDHPQIEIRDMYNNMYEQENKPLGGYKL